MREDDRFIASVEREVGRAINRYNLIKGGDRVLMGLSGGKDSLVLLETLVRRKRRIPADYYILAAYIHINGIGYESDRDYLRSFCDSLSVELRIIEREKTGDISDGRSVCYLCSAQRRKELFDLAESENCGIIALGHHLDDAVETLLMNMIFSGSISSIPPGLDIFNGKIKIVRPLSLLNEEKIAKYAQIRGFSIQSKVCPFAQSSKRGAVKNIIALIDELDKNGVNNLYRAMSNIHRDYLPPEI